jgi:hypothetical protein
VISQVRDNIGAMFGEKHKRSGGRALDFYASIALWLAHIETLKREINKVKRPYGVTIRAKCKKNKISLPFRECDFEFIFGYGIEDLGASIEWLKSINRLKDINIGPTQVKEYLNGIAEMDHKEYQQELEIVSTAVKSIWREIETSFLPKRSKYGT